LIWAGGRHSEKFRAAENESLRRFGSRYLLKKVHNGTQTGGLTKRKPKKKGKWASVKKPGTKAERSPRGC